MARWLTLRRRRQAAGGIGQEQSQVLAPYTGVSWFQRHRRLCLWILGFICSIYGYLWAIAGQYVLTMLMGPVLFIFALLVWLLPETDRTPERWLQGGLFLFLLALLCWPNYIAVALPGLPWITLIRLVGMPLAMLLLICLSLSRQFRSRTLEILEACPILWRCVVAFAIICLLSIGLSHHISESISKFVVAQVSWTSIFFVSCIVFARPGNIRHLVLTLWGVTIFLCLIGIWEWRLGRVPWAGHIPSFLAIDDPSVQNALGVQARAGTDNYRVHSKFATSLGLGEYLGIVTPFLMHVVGSARRLLVRIAAIVTLILVIFTVHLTDSRLAAIGFFISLALYLLFWAVINWRTKKESIMGAVITLGYPVLFVAMLASTFVVPRIRVEVWGDGSQAASNDARKVMYSEGIPMILKNPLGHGIGQGGETLGYRNPAGVLTIDTYYLAVGLEFGIIGFLVYYGMHIYAAVKSVTTVYKRSDGELLWLGPIAIALLNFIISKSVFSSLENHPMIFMLLGMVVALVYRAQLPSPASLPPERAADRGRIARALLGG